MKLIYIGKRFLDDEKLYQTFVDGNGKEYLWTRIQWVKIGNAYRAEKKGSGHSMSRRPDCIKEDAASEKQIKEWQAKEISAIGSYNRVMYRKKHSKESGLYKKIEELKPYVEKMSYQEKMAFVDYIMDKWTITKIPSNAALKKEKFMWKKTAKKKQKELDRALKELRKKLRKGEKKKK